jgi:hypothetical protein
MSENEISDEVLKAINAWKISLLDLTGRNQLLFLKDYKYQIDLDKLNDAEGNNFDIKRFTQELLSNSNNDQFEIAPIDFFTNDNTEDMPEQNIKNVGEVENQESEDLHLNNILQKLNEFALDKKIFDEEIIKKAFSEALKIFEDLGYSDDIEKWDEEALPNLIEETKRILNDSTSKNNQNPEKSISDLEGVTNLLNKLRDNDN